MASGSQHVKMAASSGSFEASSEFSSSSADPCATNSSTSASGGSMALPASSAKPSSNSSKVASSSSKVASKGAVGSAEPTNYPKKPVTTATKQASGSIKPASTVKKLASSTLKSRSVSSKPTSEVMPAYPSTSGFMKAAYGVAYGSTKPAYGSTKPTTPGYVKPESRFFKPTSSCMKPAPSAKKPASGLKKSAPTLQKWAPSTSKFAFPKPVAESSKPASYFKSASSSMQLAATSSQPVSSNSAIKSDALESGNDTGLEAAKAYVHSVSGVGTAPSIISNGTVPEPYIMRFKKDMMELFNDPPPGILVVCDELDFTIMHAVIIGSSGTPYEGGFFYFIIKCTPFYPLDPPSVKFMTTGGGQVRFNPNLYVCGRVCLSILGTWSGPPWTPSQTLSSLLVSIQALLLNDKPYHNEPGFEVERKPGDAERYNDIIQHETIRVAVIGMVNNEYVLSIPEPLLEKIKASFLAKYDIYEAILNSKLHLDSCKMIDPFCPVYRRGIFRHEELLKRLRDLKQKLCRAP